VNSRRKTKTRYRGLVMSECPVASTFSGDPHKESSMVLTPFLVFVLILASQVVFFAGRDAIHRALRSFGQLVSGPLRSFGHFCKRHAQELMAHGKELLLEAGRQSQERKIERELVRIKEGFARELRHYPELHQKLASGAERLNADIERSQDLPPPAPGWSDAVASIARLPALPDKSSRKILDEIKEHAVEAEKTAQKSYQRDAAARHKVLHALAPVVKEIHGALRQTNAAVSRALDVTHRVDAQIERYEQIRAGDEAARRSLAADAVVTFVISLIVTAVAAGGAFVNFQLIALPMSELVPTASRVGGVGVPQIAALVLVLMEAAAGLFLMEALGITELFPRLQTLTRDKRRLIFAMAFSALLIFAGIEASLAVLREQIVEAEMLLKATLAGAKPARSTAASIPVIGQAVLGFVLPWLLALVAVPLEMLIVSGRHVGLCAVAFLLGCVGLISRVLGRGVWFASKALSALFDLYIAVPLLFERLYQRPIQARPLPAVRAPAMPDTVPNLKRSKP
jgi:hypothetical protein